MQIVNLKHILTLNVQGFPPAKPILSAIGILLTVRIFAVAILEPLLVSTTWYRQQKA